MKCFYHQHVDAVCLCKSCKRGLCSECATDVGNGLACAGQCEESVRQINALTNYCIAQSRTSGRVLGMMGGVALSLGVFCLAAGLNNRKSKGLVLLGVMAAIVGITFLYAARQRSVYQKAVRVKEEHDF